MFTEIDKQFYTKPGPSDEAFESLEDQVDSLEIEVDAIGDQVQDVYTKEEVDDLVTSSFKGGATTATVPDELLGPQIWQATQSGTYTNFDGLVVSLTEGVNYLTFDGTTWRKTVIPIDFTEYDQKINNLKRENPVSGANRLGIGSTGAYVGIGDNNYIVKNFSVKAGSQYHIKTTIPSTGATSKRSYGFYTALPIIAANFISGDTSTTAAISTDLTVTAPTGATILAVGGNTSVVDVYSIIPLDKFSNILNVGTDKINIAPAPFERLANRRIQISDSTVVNITGTNAENSRIYVHSAIVSPVVTKTSHFLGEQFVITNGGNIHTSGTTNMASFEHDDLTEFVAGFWFKRSDLNGNDLLVSMFGGEFIANSKLTIIGAGSANAGSRSAFVDAVEGDYTHITYASESISDRVRVIVGAIGANVMTQLTIINPYVILGKQRLNPYSTPIEAKTIINSFFKGKNVTLFGDSQLSALHASQLTKVLGCSIGLVQDGSRAVKYRSGQANADLNWLYHWVRTQKIPELAATGDAFVFHCSTNDGSGGGTLDEASIQAVMDNYPNMLDVGNSSLITTKLALFNAMDDATKIATFGYKQVMGAWIRQINTLFPNAPILLCTIPISRGVETTASGIRTNQMPIFNSIRTDIYALADYYGLPVLDLNRKAGLTPENAVYHEPDGTHWSTTIQTRLGVLTAKELLNFS